MLPYHDAARVLKADYEAGRLFWLPRTPDLFKQRSEAVCKAWNMRYAGEEALTLVHGEGYRSGRIFGGRYLAHRVLWLLYSGSWPENQIDHINGDRADNRICNLREVTNAENSRNQRMPKSNTSGFIGVVPIKNSGRWVAQIRVNGITKRLGTFSDILEAVAARRSAEIECGFHEKHGRTS